MKIHWAHKWLTIPYENKSVTLQGLLLGSLNGEMVELLQQSPELNQGTVDHLPPEISSLPQQFHSVFDTPTDLPPRRSCDHVIPLLPGATPVHTKQYRYTPTLKTEIEKHVNDMLAAGIIQSSTSSFFFSSPRSQKER
jgi:hypothetical protein